MKAFSKKVHVIVIADGASDRLRVNGLSPFEMASTPALDEITKKSCVGLMQTLYSDLPKDSVVAQLGMLGYDPFKYFPGGRSYFEVPDGLDVEENDLLFRANLVHFKDDHLVSYSANYINTIEAVKVIDRINSQTKIKFPEFKLYHNSDFRNLLVVKDFKIKLESLNCPEPHEEEGNKFNIENLITSSGQDSKINRLNEYISFIHKNAQHPTANAIFPWSPSIPINLPPFSTIVGCEVKGCLIGNMDFLRGFGKSMDLSFYKRGTGCWNTDYKSKGECVIEKINEGYNFIFCHINAPDEASHMNSLEKKIDSIEKIDQYIMAPLLQYFSNNIEKLGSVTFCPDHNTNLRLDDTNKTRNEAHSLDLVPFLIWDGVVSDSVQVFSENSVVEGKYTEAVNHLDLLNLIGVKQNQNCGKEFV